MTIMRALLILILLILPSSAGCASPFRSMRSLRIDPAFGPERSSEIVSALDEWSSRVPEANIPIVVGSDQRKGGWIGPAPEARCRKIKAIAYTTLRVHHAPQIRVCMSKTNAENFRPVILHELGHALALRGDHLPERNIMHARVVEGITRLTDEDVHYVADVRP